MRDHFGQRPPIQRCICGELTDRPSIMVNGNIPICSIKCYEDYQEVQDGIALNEQSLGGLMDEMGALLEENDILLGNNAEPIKDMPEDDSRKER